MENHLAELSIENRESIIKTSNEIHNTQDRFSDEELKEFKELILCRLKEAKLDYELLKESFSFESSPSFKLWEDAADTFSKEENAQLAARRGKYIEHLQNALIRIENKTYGICRITGKLIAKERLRSVPHATMSIDAKLGNVVV